MINLMDYKKEIIAIAKANDVSWDVARDMFLANIRNAGGVELPGYPGAEEVDYLALQAQTPAQGTQEYADLCNAFNEAFRAALEGGGDA
jgi:hypothetical protein